MPSPVKPAEFKEAVVEPEDGVGEAFRKAFLMFPVLFWKWFKWKYRFDGSFTEEYEDELCEACADANANVTTNNI